MSAPLDTSTQQQDLQVEDKERQARELLSHLIAANTSQVQEVKKTLVEEFNAAYRQEKEDLCNRPVAGSFNKSAFKGSYQRNNKSGGLKNLRCFPSCGFAHREHGFCGLPVTVEVCKENLGLPADLQNNPKATEDLFSWIEFVKVDNEAKNPRVKIGDYITLDNALEMERSKKCRTMPWIRGDLIFKLEDLTHNKQVVSLETGPSALSQTCQNNEKMLTFAFNKARWGWHYGWLSSKHACRSHHAVQCYVFKRFYSNPDLLICLSKFQSPTFMLFCRRRLGHEKRKALRGDNIKKERLDFLAGVSSIVSLQASQDAMTQGRRAPVTATS